MTLRKNGALALTYGALPRSNNEIAAPTRSMVEILLEVAACIDVPAEHVTERLTSPSNRLAVAPNPRDRPMVGSFLAPARQPTLLQAYMTGTPGIGLPETILPRSEHSPS